MTILTWTISPKTLQFIGQSFKIQMKQNSLFKNYLLIFIKLIFGKEMCSMMYFIDGYIDVRYVIKGWSGCLQNVNIFQGL